MNEENVDVASLLSSFVDDKKLEEFQKEVTETYWYNKEDLSEEKEDFLPLDDVLMKESENGGRDASAGVSSWARKRFDSWRKSCRYDVNIPIGDIPLKDLSEMLVRFMLMVKKKNGDLYPAGSLSVLYRAIGRMVRKRQEKRISESGQQEVKFNIIQNEIFTRSTYAFMLAARRSRVKGVGVKTAKAPFITFNLEKDLLSDLYHQITHNRGCQKRLCFFLCSRFGIRGATELYGLLDTDLTLGSDDCGEYVCYTERESKNYQVTATRFDSSHFREPVLTHEADYVLTYKQYVRHLPPKEDGEIKNLFLAPIPKPAGNVWYAVGRVGLKSIKSWIKVMGSLVNHGEISNKSGRVSSVTCLAMAWVPAEVGMRITGHRSVHSYEKYDRTKDLQMRAAMSILSNPVLEDGTPRTYEAVLAVEVAKKNKADLTVYVASSSDALMALDPNVPVAAKGKALSDALPQNLSLFDDISDEALMNLKIHASRSLLSGNTVKDVSGLSFVGNVSNCIFITCPDSKEVAELIKKSKEALS